MRILPAHLALKHIYARSRRSNKMMSEAIDPYLNPDSRKEVRRYLRHASVGLAIASRSNRRITQIASFPVGVLLAATGTLFELIHQNHSGDLSWCNDYCARNP